MNYEKLVVGIVILLIVAALLFSLNSETAIIGIFVIVVGLLVRRLRIFLTEWR